MTVLILRMTNAIAYEIIEYMGIEVQPILQK